MTPDISLPGSGDEPASALPPPVIPGFELTRKIGEGGMGAVYEAWQTHPHRRVAIKLPRAGSISAEQWQRLGFEAEVLGRLEHPAIARLYAAGSVAAGTLTQPYLAMELVEGKPLNEYAQAHDLSLQQRLRLMQKIISGVHYAHQQGVIHRDLKPGNILVDAGGNPRILDFGIARTTSLFAANNATGNGQAGLAGTPAYMSPEQAAGRIEQVDARSDIYALGIVLFELLAGSLPYNLKGLDRADMIRTICEADPLRLQAFNRRLKGDLEFIVRKALAKSRDARYASAESFAEDLDAYLGNRPVRARPATMAYIAGTFARRHAIWVAAGTAIVLALAGGLAASTISLKRARSAEKKAQENLSKAVESVNQMTSYVADYGLSGIEGAAPIQEEIFRNAVQLYESLAQANPNDPKVKTELGWVLERLSQTARTRGDFDYTIQILGKRIELMRGLAADDPAKATEHRRALAQATFNLSRVLDRSGDKEAAAPLFAEAIGLYRQMLAEDPAATDIRIEIAYVLGNWARILSDEQAQPKYEEALAMWEKLQKEFPDDREIARSLEWVRKRLQELANTRDAPPTGPTDSARVLHAKNYDALIQSAGKQTTVTGRVEYVGLYRGRDRYTFIDFGRNRGSFSGVIHRNVMPRFTAIYGENLERLQGQDVELQGVISVFNEVPQLSLATPDQIRVKSEWTAPHAPGEIPSFDGTNLAEITEQAGRLVRVTGKVSRTGGTTENRQIYLSMSTENQPGASVIIERGQIAGLAEHLGYHPSNLTGLVIQATGYVYLYDGNPCVTIQDPSDLAVSSETTP